MKTIVITLLIFLALSSSSFAACRCICVNNERTHICTNSWDVPTGYCGGWCSGY